MRSVVGLVVALVMTMFASVGAAGAGEYSTVTGKAVPLAGSQCCLRDGQVWWADPNTCYRQGGTPTANDYCRRGGSGQYDDDYGDGYGRGHYQDPYGNPDRRVCCSSRYGIGWSSWKQCRWARGEDVRNKVCRKARGIDYNRIFGHNNNGGWGGGGGWGYDPNNNADRRVCCKRGQYDWWSSLSECRRAGGYETANRECRRD